MLTSSLYHPLSWFINFHTLKGGDSSLKPVNSWAPFFPWKWAMMASRWAGSSLG